MRRLLLVFLLLLEVPAGAATQSSAPWHLDRVDQRQLPLDGAFHYGATGHGVTAYVVDTGVRLSSTDLSGRVSTGIDLVDGGAADDCNGHGTHVAGLIGGTRYGIAKQVHVVAVRVLDCDGRGPSNRVLAGLQWVEQHHVLPAVINLSLGGAPDKALDAVVRKLVSDGVVVVTAAGNDGGDACNGSPSRTGVALTVSATDRTDHVPSWADTGKCVDLFAPGVDVTSDWYDGRTKTISGTSMASPIVAGAAAVWLERHPSGTPAQVRRALVYASTSGVVVGRGDAPDRLLRVPLTPR